MRWACACICTSAPVVSNIPIQPNWTKEVTRASLRKRTSSGVTRNSSCTWPPAAHQQTIGTRSPRLPNKSQQRQDPDHNGATTFCRIATGGMQACRRWRRKEHLCNQRAASPTGKECGRLVGGCKNPDGPTHDNVLFSMNACHPRARAMLIFSVTCPMVRPASAQRAPRVWWIWWCCVGMSR